VKQPLTRSLNIPLNPAATGQLASGRGRVRRISLRETTGTTAATLRFFDGTGTGGVLLDTIALNAGQSTRDWYPHFEYPFDGGLYLSLTGAVEGCVVVQYLGPGEPALSTVLALSLGDVLALEAQASLPVQGG